MRPCICIDNSLLMAVVTTAQQLRVYRIHINWGLPPGQTSVQANMQFAPNPTISCRQLTVMDLHPGMPSRDDSSTASYRDRSHIQLSHLEFIGPIPITKHSSAPPILLAAFSHVATPGSQAHIDPFTLFLRWELRQSQQSMHSSFAQLSSRRSGAASTNVEVS
jgi:hypothetical protein